MGNGIIIGLGLIAGLTIAILIILWPRVKKVKPGRLFYCENDIERDGGACASGQCNYCKNKKQ